MSDYISRQAALDALGVTKNATKYGGDHSGYDTRMLYEIHDALTGVPAADVVPYSIEPDGTLTVTVPKGTKVGRVLVEEDGTHWGGLYYAD